MCAYAVNPICDGTKVAGEDLSSSQYCVVKLGSTEGEVELCGASDDPYGVLQNAPAEGEPASVAIGGISKIKANGAFSYGDYLAVAASTGKVDTASGAAPYTIIAQACEDAGAANGIVAALIIKTYVPDSVAPAALTDECTQKLSLFHRVLGNVTASLAEFPLWRAPFAGSIIAAGFKEGTNGADDTDALTRVMALKIGAVSAFTTAPQLIKTATGGADTFTAGTGVQVGVLDPTKVDFVEGDYLNVAWTLTRTTPDTEIANLLLQVDVEAKVGA